MSDDLLIQGIREGDNKALSYFIKRYHNMIRIEVGKHVRNYHDAEDVIMKTIEDVWLKINTYRSMGYKLSTWVVRIARNNAIDFRRTRRNFEWSELSSFMPEHDANPEQGLIYSDGINVINRIIGELKPRNKQMVLMRRDGHSFGEIAQKFKGSETTIRVKVWRDQMLVLNKYNAINR